MRVLFILHVFLNRMSFVMPSQCSVCHTFYPFLKTGRNIKEEKVFLNVHQERKLYKKRELSMMIVTAATVWCFVVWFFSFVFCTCTYNI